MKCPKCGEEMEKAGNIYVCRKCGIKKVISKSVKLEVK